MKELQGISCSKAAELIGLSPFATLALRVSLMILRRLTFGEKDRCLEVDIRSQSLSIRVSRLPRFSSRQTRKTKCSDVLASGSTGTTEEGTGVHLPDASSWGSMTGPTSEGSSSETDATGDLKSSDVAYDGHSATLHLLR